MSVGSSHVVDELSLHPLPGDVPVVEAAERVVVVDGHLGEVVVCEGLEHVVCDGEITFLLGHEFGFFDFLCLEFWVLFAAHKHCSLPCKSKQNNMIQMHAL